MTIHHPFDRVLHGREPWAAINGDCLDIELDAGNYQIAMNRLRSAAPGSAPVRGRGRGRGKGQPCYRPGVVPTYRLEAVA